MLKALVPTSCFKAIFVFLIEELASSTTPLKEMQVVYE
jgi:hypothetical protein